MRTYFWITVDGFHEHNAIRAYVIKLTLKKKRWKTAKLGAVGFSAVRSYCGTLNHCLPLTALPCTVLQNQMLLSISILIHPKTKTLSLKQMDSSLCHRLNNWPTVLLFKNAFHRESNKKKEKSHWCIREEGEFWNKYLSLTVITACQGFNHKGSGINGETFLATHSVMLRWSTSFYFVASPSHQS